MESTYSQSVLVDDALMIATAGQSLRAVAYARRSSYGLLTSSTDGTSMLRCSSSARAKLTFSPVFRALGSTRIADAGTLSSSARSR